MLANLFFQWRYWCDIRSVAVLALFAAYSCVVFHCAVKGHTGGGGKSQQDGVSQTDMSDQVLVMGPVYSLRIHFVHQWKTERETMDDEVTALAVTAADALILVFSDSENATRNQTEVVSYFAQMRRWSLVVPLRPPHDHNASVLYLLPERRLSLAANVDISVPVVIRLRDVSSFLDGGASAQTPTPVSGLSSAVVCFLLEDDPDHIHLPSGQSLQEELSMGPEKSRVPAMAERWSRMHNASWAFFLSPCRESRTHTWDGRHLVSLGNVSLWWVCVASDALIEVSPDSQLLNVVWNGS